MLELDLVAQGGAPSPAKPHTTLTRADGPDASAQRYPRYNVRNKYEFIRTLGKGTYGKVKLAIEKHTGQKFAVKAIRKDRIKDKKDMEHIRREMKIMSPLHHPNIIRIHEVFENQDKIVIVMEYAPEGELYDYLTGKKLTSEDESRLFFKQIVSAVQYCHELGIVHRDLKLENILLGENHQIKIADFGLANLFRSDQQLHTFCGSPLYASPEIVNGVPYTGPEVDSWSLGVLLYALVYGMMPFDGSDYTTLRRQISNGEYSRQTKYPDAADLIDKMLTVNGLERADVNQVADHYWLRQAPVATFRLKTAQVRDRHLECIHAPKEASTPISPPANERLPQSVSPTPVANGCISPRPIALTSPVEQVAGRTVLAPCALENWENSTYPLNQPKGILKRFGAPVTGTANLNNARPTPQHPSQPSQSANSVPGNCTTLARDAPCGLQAKDSLKLKAKPLGASGKRRNLRSKKDRESGYYSSPERTPVEVQPVHSAAPVFTFATPVIKPRLTAMARPECLKLRQSHQADAFYSQPQYGVPAFRYVVPVPAQPIPIIEGQTVSYYAPVAVQKPMEPVLGFPYTLAPIHDDETRPPGQRPISSYSDSSILSSDSFELCNFEPPLTSTTPHSSVSLTSADTMIHAADSSNLSTLSGSTLPVSTPQAGTGRTSPVRSGALTPTSAKLNHDLSRILAPNGRRRRRTVETYLDCNSAGMGEEQATELKEMMRQLNLDLERACKKGLDTKVSLTASAEV